MLATPDRWGRLDDAVGEARERQALKPDVPVTAQGGEEKTFTTEEHRLEVSGLLDAVFDARGKGNETPRINSQRFALQLALDDRATGMDEGLAVSLQLLEDESLAAEETCAELFIEGDRK